MNTEQKQNDTASKDNVTDGLQNAKRTLNPKNEKYNRTTRNRHRGRSLVRFINNKQHYQQHYGRLTGIQKATETKKRL